MFDPIAIKSARPLVFLKRACLVLLSIYLAVGLMAAYRAYYQVRSLELQSGDSTLRVGSGIKTTVISYARTPVEVRLELVQGTHAETLAVQHVPDNEWAFLDPRSRQASQTAVLTSEILKRFEAGKAQLRATATGRPQWMRLPPPVVRELAVEIQRN